MGIWIAIILIIGVIALIFYAFGSNGNYRGFVYYLFEKSPVGNNRFGFGKIRGTFSTTGSRHLSEDVHNLTLLKLKEGDTLKLIPDPHNEFESNAIKVIFNERQIGWFHGENMMKATLYNVLLSGRAVKARCISNIRGPEYKRDNEIMKYLGLKQFVYGRFEYKS